MYHAIDEPRSAIEAGYCVLPTAFREQMAWLVGAGFSVLPLASVVDCLQAEGAAIPSRSIAITFDDGLACFKEHALPVLSQSRIPATLFAVAGKLGASNDWAAGMGWPARRLLTAAELRRVAAHGVDIGCHGRLHLPMTKASEAELVDETDTARQLLTEALGSNVRLFAYPYGAQGQRERAAVQAAGFDAACTTAPGFTRTGSDRYAIGRIDVYGSDSLSVFKRKIEFGANRVTYADVGRYYARRFAARIHG